MFAVHRSPRVLLAVLVACAAVLTGCMWNAGESKAARGMELAIQDDAVFIENKYNRFLGDRPFDLSRSLGVTRQRVNLLWAYTLPDNEFNARRKP